MFKDYTNKWQRLNKDQYIIFKIVAIVIAILVVLAFNNDLEVIKQQQKESNMYLSTQTCKMLNDTYESFWNCVNDVQDIK